MLRISGFGALVRLGVAAAVLLGTARAFAAPVVSVDISTAAGGYASYHLEQATTADPNSPGSFGLGGFVDGNAYGTNFNCDWSIAVNPDPQVTSTFNLTNLSSVTQTFIMTVTLPIAALGPATVQGGYFGDAASGTVYSDANGNGNVTFANVAGSKFYTALVNGIASQDLGTFSINSATSGSLPQQSWGTPIPSAPFGPASGNIQIKWQFSLSGGDSVSSKGFFQVEQAPEPVTLALVGLGLAALAGVRRRA